MVVVIVSWFFYKIEKSICCNSFLGGLGNEFVVWRCFFLLCKKVGVMVEYCCFFFVVGRVGCW